MIDRIKNERNRMIKYKYAASEKLVTTFYEY